MSNTDLNILPASSFSSEVWRGTLAALPIIIGFLPFGLLLGAQAVQKGIHAHDLMLMTGLNFGGGQNLRQ